MRYPITGMAVLRLITEKMLQEARLGGTPCRAYAYVEVTLVEVPADENGQTKIVEGIRTWRGKALVDDLGFLTHRRLDRPLRYEGILHDGDQERHITADVYVYQTRRTKLDASPDREGEGLQRIYVAFVGAGNTEI